MDFQGPLPRSHQGKLYILVLQCKFTKYIEAYALSNQEAVTVVDCLMERFIPHFGIPEILHTDQGANFTSKLISGLCSRLQIKKTQTAPYTPRCNGQVERSNKVLAECLAATTKQCAAGNIRQWDKYLPLICMAYNSAQHSTTKYPPAFLVYGRIPRSSMDVMFSTEDSAPVATTTDGYATQLHLRLLLLQAFDEVRRSQIISSQHQKRFHDRKVRGQPYRVGDNVFFKRHVFSEGESKKFADRWLGPYIVQKVLGPVTYEIYNTESNHRTVANYCNLKRASLRPDRLNHTPSSPSHAYS